MLNKLKIISRPIHWFEDGLLLSTVCLIIGISISQILLRNFFGSGLVWAEPALRTLVLWVALLGAMRASRTSGHIAIDILQKYYKGRGQMLIAAVAFIFSAIICLIAAYYCTEFVMLEREDGATTFLDIPAWLLETIIPVALGVMAMRFVFQSILLFFNETPSKYITNADSSQ